MRNRFFLLVLLTVAVLLAPTARAEAQDCGNWRDPVLCEVELQKTDADRRWDRFDPYRTLEIPPNTDIELELRGRDQFGRSFPQYRIALGYDDRDCGSVLEIEDRGEGRLSLRARRSDGRCRLELFAPGNMNFSWQVDIEVTPGARAGYSRDEADYIARALYRGILGREGDASGLSGAVNEIQRGNLQNQIDAMLNSNEFRQSIASAGPNDILERFYDGILGRRPDSTGVRTFLDDVERRRYSEVILGLIRSAEFEDTLSRMR